MLLIYLGGFISGVMFVIFIGYKISQKQYNGSGHVYKFNQDKCANHTWCDECAAKAIYHCTVCGHVMDR